MFRHNRVIIGLTREPILLTTPNKYARQRVYGELNMDEFEVSFTKDAFKFDLSKFLSYIKGANSEIELLLSQAENYRTNLTEEEKNKAIQLENQAQIKEYFAEKKQMQQNEPQSDPVQITNSPNKQNNPDKIIVTNIDENITSQNTEVSKKDTKLERLLIIKEILREDVELETSTYCKLLISQINRAYKYKKLYSELIVAVLRNILENHVDHCYDNLSLKSVTKFQDKLDALLDIIRNVNKQDLTKITTELTQNYTNTTFASHQTLDNLFKASFNKSVIDSLVSALHLTAHKGTNIISLGYFETNYAKQYNMLLEILGCISLYKNC